MPVCTIGVAPIVAETTFAPAVTEASDPVATPLAFVTATGCVSALPVP